MGKDGGGTKSKGKAGGGGAGGVTAATLLGPDGKGAYEASTYGTANYHNGQKATMGATQMVTLLGDAGVSDVVIVYPNGAKTVTAVMPGPIDALPAGTVVLAGKTANKWAPLNTTLVKDNPNLAGVAPAAPAAPAAPTLINQTKGAITSSVTGETYKTFSSASDAILFHQPQNQAWAPKLTKSEMTALKSYTGSGYISMNAALRSGQKPPASAVRLQKAFNKPEAVVQENFAVKRSFHWSGMGALPEGATFTDAGFTSTSINPGHNWSGDRYTILVPKGAKGAYVAPQSMHKPEAEFILQAGTTFRILKKASGQGDGILEVVVQ